MELMHEYNDGSDGPGDGNVLRNRPTCASTIPPCGFLDSGGLSGGTRGLGRPTLPCTSTELSAVLQGWRGWYHRPRICPHVLDPCFINIIDTHRGWTSLPSNQRMPPEEPVYACAMPCMAISNYAAVDWDASDIIMLRVEHRYQFEQLWFDTFLMRYRGPFVLPRPFTEEELKLWVMVHKSIEAEQLAEFLKPRKTDVSADWS